MTSNELQQGIEFTIKTLMKVKEEIAVLRSEIDHRDMVLEKWAKDIERLKTENDEIQRMKEELAYFKRIHQEEMKEKCEKELNHLRSKTNFQNEFDAWIFYCKKTFNYENLKVEYYEDIDKFSCELQFKIQKMSEHEEAFLALAKTSVLLKT